MGINNCILCNSNNNTEIYIQHRDFEIVYCKTCNLYYQQTVKHVDLEEMYNNIYQAKPPDTKNKRYWKNRIKAIYEDIYPHHKQPGTLLDVGCSYGLLMEYFISRGWRATGIDICENAILHAKEKGLNCYVAAAENFKSDRKFDVIIMDNTLEHFENPLKSLFSLKDLLAQDGIIYIRVPNVESVVLFSGFRNFLGNMKPFEHLFYFSKSALALLL
ncbi:MAG: class I SAM-dependent methyltransferase, partial [Candidatus Omnitrophica bacterium]|nr:class I SAM-dependent methyltransferase [Candidatus Omnitrophota bacterium]